MTKQELLQEGCILSNTIHQKYEQILGTPQPDGYIFDDEQRYRNWLEAVQGFVYKNKIYPEQYDDFKWHKEHISPESHKSILAIINSIE